VPLRNGAPDLLEEFCGWFELSTDVEWIYDDRFQLLDDFGILNSIHLQVKQLFQDCAAFLKLAKCGRAVTVEPNQLESGTLELKHWSSLGSLREKTQVPTTLPS
jgi:hypothetical protein